MLEEIRLNKYIASSGICSRRAAEEYITSGDIKINGQVVTDLGTKVTSKDKVYLKDKLIKLENKKVYIMLNKPVGYVTTSKEQFNRPSVLDLVDVEERVYAVGRLDMDSEGLLLLTNDGEFTNNIIHPTKHITKTYEVKLKKEIDSPSIHKLEKGIDIGGYVTRRSNVVKTGKDRILITISEGKNRQVRKMCEAVGNKVMKLKRIKIGNLELGDLKSGEYIKLNKKQIDKIFE